MSSTLTKGLRISAAFAILGAIVACGGSDDESAESTASPTAAAEPTPAPAAPTPTPAPTPAAGASAIALTSGFLPDPHTATGMASGAAPATTLGPNAAACAGQIPAQPQHTLTLQSDFANLRILVSSAVDTNLVIRKPDGTFACNDDSEGLNPIVQGAFPAGTYQVYVGTYNTATTGSYTIGFSELSSVTAASL